MSDYNKLTNEELEDYISRVLVQLEPTLSQQTISIIQEVLEYRTKIENKTLVELPCKIGDKVYYVNENSPTPRIEEYVVYGILLDESRIILHIDYWETIMAKDVYYTKSEAEAKLEQIRKGE